MKWPGKASVEIVLSWYTKETFHGVKRIDGYPVENISSTLSFEEELPDPFELLSNKKLICKGHELQGDGFKLGRAEAQQLINQDYSNADVLAPLVTGDDINNSTEIRPSSYVINFTNLSLEKASKYPRLLKLVEERVKPERMVYQGSTGRDKYLRTYWWLFRGFRNELHEYSLEHDKFLVLSVVSKYRSFIFVPSSFVPTAATSCFLFDKYSDFTCLQSSIHEAWVEKYGSSLGETLRYIAGRCFKTFPLLTMTNDALESIGEQYYLFRSSLMIQENIGLTSIYNRLHSENDRDEPIVNFRRFQIEMDQAVAAAYGWDDLVLDHGFHETKQGLRFTISEGARREVLQRLLKLNHVRYEEEVAKGLHDKKKRSSTYRKKSKSQIKIIDHQGLLFGSVERGSDHGK
jgi:hypothetical protein